MVCIRMLVGIDGRYTYVVLSMRDDGIRMLVGIDGRYTYVVLSMRDDGIRMLVGIDGMLRTYSYLCSTQ